MGSSRRPPRGKKINPHFWVFCEGETEEAYVRFLRSEYRLPLEVITKVAGSSINENYIKKHKRGKFTHEKDRDFLIYDADVPEIIERLKKIKSAELIASNPAVEFWFLLHYKNQTSRISEEECVKELSNRNKNIYKKGFIDDKLKAKLKGRCTEACSRAKQLKLFENPSTNMNAFIEALENAKNETP
ncbi:RloB family protein [Perlabentimonas gracilis]|uniref:RloB family protein n=1 Tax=Perlabentimonas gracilis TaxID=2715279 RepID=UPI00140C2AA6|nr:RloB family protein [Perlabentimonas gracilis]NHB70216.1 RloB domain-containing protein [Perlabentimonas gracilis]